MTEAPVLIIAALPGTACEVSISVSSSAPLVR